ncbi:PAAR domain-containing protein [Stutzerimonas balearica]|uniref:PAAR domain-containing protein n=2 Tax=Stutzerimonas TaxID=2901164 RepID=A0A9X7YQN6_9GAMM|nr:PAAR domain-containing protein [Stutzerimonas balearica]KIL03686.1 type IV secretion protein Rhs [Stutzerimonas stutzeri]MBB62710.1 type IV secretion protein Rhs [Pseudomonas sp.]QQN49237.1 PAAR domain-containing protein [Stutzerimonas balearica]WIX03062.1 PAAR domain-containing protein [Pseudomonas sp. AR5]
MSGKPAARLGDPTACPVPGHGNNPIEAGSPDVLFDGLPAARMGDASACGGAMASAVIPTVLINGKPAAVVGSVGNHGNVVTAGSGTVVIGSSHNAAPFLAPAALGIAKAVTAAAAVAEAFRSSEPIARTWQEEPGDLAPLGVEEEDEEEELAEQPQQQARQAITLRIGVFFDGTGNNLANAAVTEQCRDDDLQQLGERTLQEVIDYCQRHGFSDSNDDGYFTEAPDGSYGNAPSNVARLYGLYRDDSFQTLDANVREGFLKVYLDGIGTSSGEADSLYGQITGRGDTGILARVKQSPETVKEQLSLFQGSNPDLQIDTLEFDIFGFSRGAAAARHFANELLKPGGGVLAGTLRPGQYGLVDNFDWAAHARINFIGLFDTVAAVIDPLKGDYDPANHLNPGINLYLPPGCARKVLQLTARDEKRWNFALNRVAPDHQEICLPGAHSDIGGGYRPLMLEQLLLSRPLSSTVPANTPPEQTHASRETWRQYHQWKALGLPDEALKEPKVWPSRKPVFYERGFKRPPEDVVYGLLPIKRQVRGELSLVYLRVMRELAAQNNVPLRPIQDRDPALALPTELQNIADKLMAYAQGGRYGLEEEDERLLWSRYIHLSAHWTPSSGLLISKPAPNVRLTYNNKPQQGYPE